MPSLRPLLGALAAAALLTAGCGSSDDAAETTAAKPAAAKTAPAKPRPTRAAYVKQADAVCRDARAIGRRANVAVRKAYKANDAGGAADAIDRYRPMYAAKVKELEALTRPEGKNKGLTDFMRVMDAQVTALETTAKALRTSNGDALKKLTKFEAQAQQYAEALGKQLGFEICGRAA